jgi:two-component system, LytTR family, sensor kinase
MLSKKANIFLNLLYWFFMTLIVAKYSPNDSPNTEDKLLYLALVFGSGLASTLIYIRIHYHVLGKTPSLGFNIVSLCIGILGTAFLLMVIDLLYFGPVKVATKYNNPYEIFVLLLDEMWLVAPWYLTHHLLAYSRLSYKEYNYRLELEERLKNAQLEALKQQLNPHFLFNSLNSIKALTLGSPLTARMAITELSELLRMLLNLEDRKKILFTEELAMSEYYLALEKIRFDKRLNYDFDIQDEAHNVLIVPLGLQTMIENAVKHGIGKAKHGGTIWVKAFIKDKKLIVKVSNEGSYIPQKNTRRGVGVQNLQKRLEINYGSEASFTVKGLPKNMVEATLILPAEDVTNLPINELDDSGQPRSSHAISSRSELFQQFSETSLV